MYTKRDTYAYKRSCTYTKEEVGKGRRMEWRWYDGGEFSSEATKKLLRETLR